MMAWTEAVPSSAAFRASGVMIEQMSLGVSSELAYQAVIDAGLGSAVNRDGLVAALEHISPGDDEVRLVELPTLMLDGRPMRDGANISAQVTGTPGDGNPDRLSVDLSVIGVDDPSRYRVRYEVDGRAAPGTYDLTAARPADLPYAYQVSHDIDLGLDIPDDEIDLTAIVDLPEGGDSRYSVQVVARGAGAVITVGSDTWAFVLTDFYGGCITSGDGSIVAAGAVDDDPEGITFIAELHPDGGSLDVVDQATGRHWMANADRTGMTVLHEIADGDSQIDDIALEGGRAVGSATFIDTAAVQQAWSAHLPFPPPVPGTFEITCPGS